MGNIDWDWSCYRLRVKKSDRDAIDAGSLSASHFFALVFLAFVTNIMYLLDQKFKIIKLKKKKTIINST